jgi:hypothetical protein
VLDSRVARLIVETLRPLTPEIVRDTVARLMADTERRRTELRLELATARQQATLAEHRLEAVDPSNARVVTKLARDLEEALAHLEAVTLKVEAMTKMLPAKPTSAELEQIRSLATDLETLWVAPTTTNEDRKAIVRLLFESGLVEQVDDLFWELRLTWTSGVSSVIRFVKPDKVVDYAFYLHRQGLTPTEIVSTLNAEGLRPRSRKRASFDTVLVKSGLRDRFGVSFDGVLHRRRCIESLARQGLTADQITEELNRRQMRIKRGKPYKPADVRYVLRGLKRVSRPDPTSEADPLDDVRVSQTPQR